MIFINKKLVPKILKHSLHVFALLFLFGLAVFAWTEPGQPPPDGNVDAPLNVGATGQSKKGNLALNTDGVLEYGLLVPFGSVGIGDISPASLLTVGSGDLFQVNSSGNLIKVNKVSYSWPASQGSTGTFLKNDGSGNLSWAAAGGGGANSYVYSPNAGLWIGAGPNFNWQDIDSKTLANVPANTLLLIDANIHINMFYQDWPDGTDTVLNGRIRVTVNGQELKTCYVNNISRINVDFGSCSISALLLTPSAGDYIIKLQGKKLNADHGASFFNADLRAVGLPYSP